MNNMLFNNLITEAKSAVQDAQNILHNIKYELPDSFGPGNLSFSQLLQNQQLLYNPKIFQKSNQKLHKTIDSIVNDLDISEEESKFLKWMKINENNLFVQMKIEIFDYYLYVYIDNEKILFTGLEYPLKVINRFNYSNDKNIILQQVIL